MLKVLVKKQLSEIFKGYFYDAKKNRLRSKGAIVGWFVFFFFIIFGVLGGTFTFLALATCETLSFAGMGWLYFLLMAGVATLLGAFGSVFSTYSGLYLSKDNDLLLSMPIPVRTILTARLLSVYLTGTIYVAAVLLPVLGVYWALVDLSFASVVCGLLLFLIVSVTVLILSCLLGWVVAKISLRLKNKSFVVVLIALAFIAAYYFFYFRAQMLLRELLENADFYGEQIMGAVYGLYLFGRIGEGDWAAAAIFLGATALVFSLVCLVLGRSFLRIATASAKTPHLRYTEKTARRKTAFRALFGKELARFTSSPNYMLNCGLGIVLLPVLGVLALIKGSEVRDVINTLLTGRGEAAAVVFCAALCLVSTMNDTAAPAVSLEGKSIWIPQSLPVMPKTVLRAKLALQLLLSGAPMLVAGIMTALAANWALPIRLLLVTTPLLFVFFFGTFAAFLGMKMPLLNWTTEIVPIKQSGAVAIALFGGWGFCAAFALLYLALGHLLGAGWYLLIWNILFAGAGLLLLRELDTRCAKAFSAL